LAEAWCKAVEERTNGQVKIEYYPGQTLTKAKQCYDGTIYGLSDIGFSVFGYTRGRFPVMAAVDLPVGYTSGAQATRVANAVYDKFKPKELRDTQVMYLHAHGPGLVHSRNKPILRLEDMKGLKFRSTGTSALAVKALGGTPVPKPMPEAYQMLQKGVVDGSVYPLESNKGWRLGEVTHYATAAYTAAYTTTFFVVMNKGKWVSLPPEVQQTIAEINTEWAVKHGEAWDASDMAGIVYFLKQGGQINGQDRDEAGRWRQAVAPVIEDYVNKTEKKGIDARAVIDFINRTLKELES